MEYREQFNQLPEEEQNKILQCGFWLFEYIWDISKKEDVYAILHRKIKSEVTRNEKILSQQYAKKEGVLAKELDIKQEQIEALKNECLVLRNIHKDDTKLSYLAEQITQFRTEFGSFMTPQRKGKAAEGFVYNMLCERYPKSIVKDISSIKGSGDIYMEYENMRIMFEVKSTTEESLRSHPTETIGRFQSDVRKSVESGITNCGVFVSARTSSIPGHGVFDVEECINSVVGKYYLVYVADIFQYPDRLYFVVEISRFLYINSDDQDKIRVVLNNVSKVNTKLGVMVRMIKEMKTSINKQYKVCKDLEQEVSNIGYILKGMEVVDEEDNVADNLDKLGKLYAMLANRAENGKVTKAMLLEHLGESGVVGVTRYALGRTEMGYDMRSIRRSAQRYLGVLP